MKHKNPPACLQPITQTFSCYSLMIADNEISNSIFLLIHLDDLLWALAIATV